MKPEWHIELGLGIPDSTTEAIEEIDKSLAVTEDVWFNSVCLICDSDKPGVHIHMIGEGV